jgi:hypothetical protein
MHRGWLRCWRCFVAGFVCVLVTACLGQDYKNVELGLSEWDHGWLAVVEPDEQFSVILQENPQYPGVEWGIAEIDPPIIDVVGYIAEGPEDWPEEERQLSIWGFDLVGTELGEVLATFEIDVDGRTVDMVQYRIAVVDDACEGDVGLTAPRCRRQHQESWAQAISEWDHGTTIDLAPGEELTVQLTANAAAPGAVWELAESDPVVVDVSTPRPLGTRAPGNWDTTDGTEPGWFLPRWEFMITPNAPGESQLRFELVDAGGIVEFCEFTVDVRD